MIERVCKYQTTDGQLHDSRKDAEQHQLKVDIMNKLKAIYHPNFATNRADSLLIGIMSDPKPFRDALTYYIQRQPKEKA